MRNLLISLGIMTLIAIGGLLTLATSKAEKRLQERILQCRRSYCPLGKPDMLFLTVFDEGRCVCFPPEPVMAHP